MKKGPRLAEVCKELDLQPYVLRYWLTEFPTLRRKDSGSSSQRVFDDEEIAVLSRIKTLLYDEGYTIAGAKKKLESEPAVAEQQPPKRGGGKRATAKATHEEPASGGEDDAGGAPQLDTSDDERIETLRRGLADALAEARAILDRLQARR